MNTLQKLRNKYKKLKEESDNIYSKIREIEKKSEFTVGNCYLDTIYNNLIKIVSIEDNYVYYICLDKAYISRDASYMFDIEGWERITLEQFKNAYLATMKDIRDPDLDLGDKESNWSIVYNSIVTSINEK